MEPLSMNTLASSLPSAQQQAQANDLSAKFKDAALAITTLYRASTAAQKRAYNTGYSAALQDIMAYIRAGLSDGATMNVGTVMDYAEARASAIADDEEEDAPAPPPVAALKVHDKLKNKPAPTPQTVTHSTTSSAKENRRRKHSSASPSPPPSVISAPAPISLATSVSAPAPGKMKLQDTSRAPSPVVGTKRRHQSFVADGLGIGFGMGNTLQPTNGEPSQRMKKGKPKSSRVPNPAVPPLASLFGLGVEEDMDVEEERPRKRR